MKQIIRLINNSKKTRYQISKETNIPQSTLSRIVHGKQKNIELATAEMLLKALGYEIVFRKVDKNVENGKRKIESLL
ncbi:helix-turn-helix domain-containing protein [Allofustis seminis]|uniref:helix-turn-helix domain-containing protein n=1 Tax=Allofustis seminis TaxID=166939 RepID=UPI000375E1B0|nr:helix-turn-helix transcriptional regulator [Allofustis seminis]